MSEIKVNSIKGVGASVAALSIGNSGGTCTANLTNKPNRNLIINGAMQCAQYGSSSTANGYGSVDRIFVGYSGTDEAPTQAQADVAAGTTPYTLGFRKSYKITNGNQTSGAGTSDRVTIEYRIEAQDIANSGWNYNSESSFVTFSYWVKSSVAQNFYNRFKSADSPQQAYAFETGSLSADTWTKITKTIPGNSNIVFNNDNGEGLSITWEIFRGTDNTGTRPLNAWAAASGTTRTPDQTSTWYTTNDATFEITGVQLEVGSVATDFEHRSFGDELARCQRYFYMHASGAEDASNSASVPIGLGYGYSSTSCFVVVKFPVTMRSNPTMFKATGSNYFQFSHNGSNAYPDNVGNNRAATNSAEIYFDTNSSWTQNDGGMVRTNNSSARVGFSAEL